MYSRMKSNCFQGTKFLLYPKFISLEFLILYNNKKETLFQAYKIIILNYSL